MTAYTDGVGFYGFCAFFQAIINELGGARRSRAWPPRSGD